MYTISVQNEINQIKSIACFSVNFQHDPGRASDRDTSILALKPMGEVNRRPKQSVPVGPQNGDIVNANKFKKRYRVEGNEQILLEFFS